MVDASVFSIGDLATRTGTKVETIRYYEKAGLMPAAARTAGNQRAYTRAHLDRLAFIRHSRELGFPLADVRTLLAMTDDPGQSCAEVDAIARGHLAAVRSRITRLEALEAELSRMVGECGCGRVADCRVIEVLADQTHTHCLQADHHGTDLWIATGDGLSGLGSLAATLTLTAVVPAAAAGTSPGRRGNRLSAWNSLSSTAKPSPLAIRPRRGGIGEGRSRGARGAGLVGKQRAVGGAQRPAVADVPG